MREIKFRIWDSKSRGMFETFGDWYIDHEYGTFSILMEVTYNDKKHLALMQYVGLKDRNDKEIYEGDIVKKLFESGNVFVGEVVFEDGAYFVKRDEEYAFLTNQYKDEEIEVIGNKFEHPHLLEETK